MVNPVFFKIVRHNHSSVVNNVLISNNVSASSGLELVSSPQTSQKLSLQPHLKLKLVSINYKHLLRNSLIILFNVIVWSLTRFTNLYFNTYEITLLMLWLLVRPSTKFKTLIYHKRVRTLLLSTFCRVTHLIEII